MTEEEKTRLVEEKARVSRALARIDISRFDLSATDPRLEEYVREVAGNPSRHNLWEQLAVERFLRMARRYGIDRVSVQRFFHFYESLYFPGKKGLTRYKLTPVQSFQFASVYAFKDEDGERVVRECVLYVPRKFSKTTGTAAFAVYDLLLGDANAEVYIGANSQMQAKKCFDVIRGCLRKLDTHGKRWIINEEEVKPTRRSPRQSLAQCLTANARTKDGMNASTVIMDEFSQARDSELLTVLTTSMGVREEPLTVIITTASDVFEGPFYAMLQGYKSLLLGDFEDDTVFCHLFEPDVGDAEDSEETWHKVHPHLGITVQEGFYEDEYRKAMRNGAEAMLAFRTKLLNVYTENTAKAWLPATLIRERCRAFEFREIGENLPATVGVDLSVRDDFSAVTFGIYDEETGSFYFKTVYFIPRGGLENHPNEQLYRKWAAEGNLIIQEGEVIDYAGIVEYILKESEGLQIMAICFDPAKSKDFQNMMGATELGFAMKPFRQTNFYFTSAVQAHEIAARTGHVWYDMNPITPYCFGNAVLDVDNMGNMKPYKRTPSGKIDGVITILMSQAAFMDILRPAY